jgi:hypothetical protein
MLELEIKELKKYLTWSIQKNNCVVHYIMIMCMDIITMFIVVLPSSYCVGLFRTLLTFDVQGLTICGWVVEIGFII